MQSDQGVIISPTGSGKSLIGLEIIRQRKQKSLIIVHNKELAAQWKRLIEKHFGLKTGFIGQGKWHIGDEVTIALVQTLARRDDLSRLNCFGLVIVDEVHHAPAKTYLSVLNNIPAKYRFGLSATPNRRDGLEEVIYRAIGQTIVNISREEVEDLGATVPAIVYSIDTGFTPGELSSWHEYLSVIATSEGRNEFIANLALSAGNGVLVLCDRIEHANSISKKLHEKNADHALIYGKLPKTNRESAMSKAHSAKITIGTSGILGEGIDLAHWKTLILASPFSSEVKLIQAIGRIVRPSGGKSSCAVYDLKDNCGFSGASYGKRKEIYTKYDMQIIKQSHRYKTPNGSK